MKIDLDEFPVHVGHCVADGKRFRAQAHAHVNGAYRGWICVLSAKRTTDRNLMLHEIAHAISGEGHTNGWRRTLVSIGGSLNATEHQKDYHKRNKSPARYAGLYAVHAADCPCRSVSR